MNILTVDFHAHILPGVDDGCKTVAESLQVIRMEQKQGIHTIFLTPHFRAQSSNPDEFVHKRASAMHILQDALLFEQDAPQLLLGAEVSFCPGMSRWESLPRLTMGNTGCLMIEMPAGQWSDRIFAELEAIYYDRGITPILAHVERYFHPLCLQGMLRKLSQLPVLLQMNCSFLNGKRTSRQAFKILNNYNIHLLGSDCHGVTWRAPDIDTARKTLLEKLDPEPLSFLSQFEEMVLQGKLQA